MDFLMLSPFSILRTNSSCLFFFIIYLFFIFLNFILFIFFIQQVLISRPFYTHQCIHVNPNLPIHPTTTHPPPRLSPLGVHTFVLYICVSISALQTGSCVPFSRFHISTNYFFRAVLGSQQN